MSRQSNFNARKRGNRNRRRQAKSQPVSPTSSKPSATISARESIHITPAPHGPESPVSAAAPEAAIATVFALPALCLLITLSYLPATWAGLVWDDVVLTMAQPLQHLSGLWDIWFAPRSLSQFEGHYWPLLYTSFWLENRLWGVTPVGYHIVNLVLHGLVTVLLWRLLLRLAVPGAWFAAAVFAVHPLHVESVAWIIGRKDVLASLFYLACVLSYLHFIEARRRRFYAAALALFMAGLLCKSILVTLPVSLLIWHWWQQGRVTPADVRRVLPFLLLGLCVTIADVLFYKSRDPTAFDYSIVERLLIAAQALWFYLGKLVWPTQLAVIYPRWEVGVANPLAWGCLMAAFAAVAALWFGRHRIGRGPLAGALFFVVTLSPTLGFVDYGYMLYSFVADRYQYLAGAGVIATLAAAVTLGMGRLPGAYRRGAQGMAVLPLAALGVITWNQAGIYRDNYTFYSHVLSLNPQARFAHHSIGLEYQKQGRHEEALAAFETDYRLAPEQPSPRVRMSKAQTSIGTSLAALGRIQEAEEHFRRGVEIAPDFPGAYDHLGGFLITHKRYREALEVFQAVITITPGNARFHVGLGVSQAGLGRLDEALQSYERALLIDPLQEQALSNRASLLKFRESGGG